MTLSHTHLFNMILNERIIFTFFDWSLINDSKNLSDLLLSVFLFSILGDLLGFCLWFSIFKKLNTDYPEVFLEKIYRLTWFFSIVLVIVPSALSDWNDSFIDSNDECCWAYSTTNAFILFIRLKKFYSRKKDLNWS